MTRPLLDLSYEYNPDITPRVREYRALYSILFPSTVVDTEIPGNYLILGSLR
jgi:hypothetical protein